MPRWGLGIMIPLMVQMEKPRPVDDEAGEDAVAVGDATDHREIRGAIEAIARDYPEVSAERIEQLVRESYRRRGEATILQYRGVLAERDARARLRAEARSRGIRGATGQPRSTERPSDTLGGTRDEPSAPPLTAPPRRRWRPARRGAAS